MKKVIEVFNRGSGDRVANDKINIHNAMATKQLPGIGMHAVQHKITQTIVEGGNNYYVGGLACCACAKVQRSK